jgi:hypothetical protein
LSQLGNYTDSRSGAGVLDTGTSNWIPALGHDRSGCAPRGRPAGHGAGAHCAAAVIQRITGNILLAFGSGPAARRHPSVANWHQVTGQ